MVSRDRDPLSQLLDEFWDGAQLPTAERMMAEIKHNMSYLKIRKLDDRPQFQHYLGLREDVARWTMAFGGITTWASKLEDLFHQALHKDQATAMELVERLWLHQTKGKLLLRRLEDIEGYLPFSRVAISMWWYNQQALVVEVVKGLTILELQLPVMFRTTCRTLEALKISNPSTAAIKQLGIAIFHSQDGKVHDDYLKPLPASDDEK